MTVLFPAESMNGSNSTWVLAAATCAAMATLIPVAAHQIGVIDHLPDPPGRVFASDRITNSSRHIRWVYPMAFSEWRVTA